jgi:uncharacterized protein (DUF1800 family)
LKPVFCLLASRKFSQLFGICKRLTYQISRFITAFYGELMKQQLTALILILQLFTSGFAFSLVDSGEGDSKRDAAKPLSDNQKILHVLNRLGFGARPGDVEKVKALGLQKYIEQQLNPGSISDAMAEDKVKNLEVFRMSTAEIFAKYPNPGALVQMLERQGKNQNSTRAKSDGKRENGGENAGSMPDDGMNGEMSKEEQAERRERRRQLTEIYQRYNLKPASQIHPQVLTNRMLRAVYSEKQLQEVMVDFWQNHFNVFFGKAAVRWYIPSYERDVLRKHALGNFKDLVINTAQHPAMLFYLDNFQSMSPDANPGNGGQRRLGQNGQINARMRERLKEQYGVTDQQINERLKQMRDNPQQGAQNRQRGINENYARELMELHTLGVDGGYTQKDIVEVARAFTGWTISDPRGYRKAAAKMINGREPRGGGLFGMGEQSESGEFVFNSRWHDSGEKTVLGQKVKEGGMKDGLKVIDILVNHPSTAKFIARKLAVKFVSDTPSDALVGRVAKAFGDSRGDVKTTLRALFSDPEFFAPQNYRAKIKTPFELAVSAVRTLGADTNAGPAMLAMLQKLGEFPYGYQAPTGYPDTAEDWVNTGALLERLNFAVAVASNRIPGTKVDLKAFEAKDKQQILTKAIEDVLEGEISTATKNTLLKQIEQPLPQVTAGSDMDDELELDNMRPNGGQGQGRRQGMQVRLLEPSGNPEVFKVVSFVLGTPEFQRQ